MGAFSDLIERELHRRGLSNRAADREAARRGHSVSYQTWSNWKKGAEVPAVRSSMIDAAAEVLGISAQTIRDAILADERGQQLEELQDETGERAIVYLQDMVREGRMSADEIARLIRLAEDEGRRNS